MLGRVTLVTGKEEFLGERTVAAVRDGGPPPRRRGRALRDRWRPSLTMATLGELAAPSLFSTTRCVVVRGLEDLPEESVDGLLDYAAAPAEDVALVLVHGGGQKGSGRADQAAQARAGHRGEVGRAQGLASSRRSWPPRCARHGAAIDPDAAELLVQAVGQDLRSLSAAAHQLANDFPGEPLDRREGQAATSAAGPRPSRSPSPTHAFSGRPAGARGAALGARQRHRRRCWSPRRSPAALRGLARYKARRAGCATPTWPARSACPPWKLRTIRDQSRGWSDAGLARAIRAVAQADADIKGAASDASYTLERLVLDRRRRCATRAEPGRSVRERRRRRPGGYDAPGGAVSAGARSERGGLLGDRPTCGWRPGSCG